MTGKSTIESYFDFKADWIIEFNRLVLPKVSLKKIDLDQFKKNVYKYYIEVFFNNKKLNDLFLEEDIKVNIQKSLVFNGIIDEKFQILFASLFKEELIISWLNELTEEEKMRKNLCMELATTVYLALELDKHISPNASKKIAYNQAIKELLDKYSKQITNEMIDNIRNNSVKLSKLFAIRQTKNFKFIKLNNEIKEFKVVYESIYQTIDSSKTNMYLSNLNYSIKELSKESKKEVLKIASKDIIKNNLKKIELELVSYDLFKKLYNHQFQIIFVKLNDNFLSSKNNISAIENTICAVKNYIILNISYGQSIKYKNVVDELKSKGYQVAYAKDENDVSFKKLYDTKYFFIEYEESIAYTKTISELEIGKIEPIVSNLNLENRKSSIKYYMK